MKRTTTLGSLHHKPVQSSYNQKLSSGVNKLAGQSTEAEKLMAYSDAETTSPPVYYLGSLPMEGIPRVSAKGSCVDFHDLCRKVLYGNG
ncbi:CIC11C00000002801 [Sungouiella intermedia]|uniref:CIC11C00000002801 n=1 Tax=Sungouiella intermedia TaxID=45354 RepID=A0A1L0BGR7_9ASCO|nr:CIC11C00000002801 [[Candida] intermedia]